MLPFDRKWLIGLGAAGIAYFCYQKHQQKKLLSFSPSEESESGNKVLQFPSGGKSSLQPQGSQVVPAPAQGQTVAKDTSKVSGDIVIDGRPAFQLIPESLSASTPIFVILHGSYGERGKPHNLGIAAIEGGTVSNLLTPQGAAEQALVLMGRKAWQDGYIVLYLAAKHKQQWDDNDVAYVKQAISEIQQRTGTQGAVNVTGAAAGLLISGKVLQQFKQGVS